MHCTEQQIVLIIPLWLFEVFAPLHTCEGLLQDHEAEPQNIGLGSLHPEVTCWYCRQTHTHLGTQAYAATLSDLA